MRCDNTIYTTSPVINPQLFKRVRMDDRVCLSVARSYVYMRWQIYDIIDYILNL